MYYTSIFKKILFFAGLVGLGLLYQGTGHRHMAEVCLTELGRPPGPEMENCTDRESYSLAAGNKENVFLILFYAAGHTG